MGIFILQDYKLHDSMKFLPLVPQEKQKGLEAWLKW
jgi:hypothetical protein